MRIRDSYRCKQCDFDLCRTCFKRKNRSRGENQVRGDKGAKDDKEISSTGYMRRSLRMAKPHIPLLLFATLCLIATTTAGILLPNYQGRILDAVIHMDKDAFTADIRFFIGISVATGLFGGLQSLCFRVVGAKMSNDVR